LNGISWDFRKGEGISDPPGPRDLPGSRRAGICDGRTEPAGIDEGKGFSEGEWAAGHGCGDRGNERGDSTGRRSARNGGHGTFRPALATSGRRLSRSHRHCWRRVMDILHAGSSTKISQYLGSGGEVGGSMNVSGRRRHCGWGFSHLLRAGQMLNGVRS
jgi:hypothetical protein